MGDDKIREAVNKAVRDLQVHQWPERMIYFCSETEARRLDNMPAIDRKAWLAQRGFDAHQAYKIIPTGAEHG